MATARTLAVTDQEGGHRFRWAVGLSLLLNLGLWAGLAHIADRHVAPAPPLEIQFVRVTPEPPARRTSTPPARPQPTPRPLRQVSAVEPPRRPVRRRPAPVHPVAPVPPPPPRRVVQMAAIPAPSPPPRAPEEAPRPVDPVTAVPAPSPAPAPTPAPAPAAPEPAPGIAPAAGAAGGPSLRTPGGRNRGLTALPGSGAQGSAPAGGNVVPGRPGEGQGTGTRTEAPAPGAAGGGIRGERPGIALPARPRPQPSLPSAAPPGFAPPPRDEGKAGSPPGATVPQPEPLPTPPKPEPEPRPAPKPRGATRDAEPARTVQPEIPDSLKRTEFRSFVRVRVEVSEDGSSSPVIRAGSGNADIDRRVLEALRQWQWKPALRDGQPVRSTQLFKFEFEVN